MSDLGMGEDQGKIDALEQYLEENLAAFFSEDSYMSSVIKMGYRGTGKLDLIWILPCRSCSPNIKKRLLQL